MVLPGSITSPTSDSLQLLADGGFLANNYFSYHYLLITYNKHCTNLVTLSLGKLCVAYKRSFDWQVFRGLSYRSLPLLIIKGALVSWTYESKYGTGGDRKPVFHCHIWQSLDLPFTGEYNAIKRYKAKSPSWTWATHAQTLWTLATVTFRLIDSQQQR